MEKSKLDQLNRELSLVKSKALLKTHYFYSSIIVSLNYKFKEDVETAYTDGLSIVIGVDFWNELNINERLFLLLHETMHIVLKHVQRYKDMKLEHKNQTIWNYAADYFINNTLDNDNQGHYQCIDSGLLDHKYDGLSTDEIYRELLKDSNNSNEGFGLPELGGIGNDLKPSDKTSNSTAEQEIDSIIKSAITNSKTKGNYSSNSVFTNTMDLMLKIPKVNWKTALNRYMNIKFKDTRNYARPNRRVAFNRKLVIKTPKLNVKIGDLLVYIDVSGSCEEEDITNMATELYHIMSVYKPDSILFSTFNTEIQQTFKLKNTRDIPTDLIVSGGTDIQCVTDHINDHKNKVCVSVIMTDAWSSEWELPSTPLIMLIVNNPDYTREGVTVIHYEP